MPSDVDIIICILGLINTPVCGNKYTSILKVRKLECSWDNVVWYWFLSFTCDWQCVRSTFNTKKGCKYSTGNISTCNENAYLYFIYLVYTIWSVYTQAIKRYGLDYVRQCITQQKNTTELLIIIQAHIILLMLCLFRCTIFTNKCPKKRKRFFTKTWCLAKIARLTTNGQLTRTNSQTWMVN